MFLEALQAYYAPSVMALLFVGCILYDKLFSKRIKRLFLIETAVILVIIAATWADRCLSAMSGDAWFFRTITTFLNFTVSSYSPAILVSIYMSRDEIMKLFKYMFYLPLLINTLLCGASCFKGFVFSISRDNVYEIGDFFFVPFLITAFYMMALMVVSTKKKNKIKQSEIWLLIAIMICIVIATLLEIIFVKRYMIWSTTFIAVVIYFVFLNIQKTLYDPLSGAYNRAVYDQEIENINMKKYCVYAMIDVNGLKDINDSMGHAKGDELLAKVAGHIMKNLSVRMKLYRIGGDEFAVIIDGHKAVALRNALEKALASCKNDGQISFAYGIMDYVPSEDIHNIIKLADEKMYSCKRSLKSN